MVKELTQYFPARVYNMLNKVFGNMQYCSMRKQFLIVTACVCLVLFAPFNTHAADGGIGVTVVNYTLNSSHEVTLDYTITINAEVTNFDSTAFTGHLSFGLRNNQGIITSGDIFGGPPYSGNIISLHGHETIPAIFSVTITSQYFAPGPDVVVIWPIFSGTPQDSIIIPINIVTPNGINNTKEKRIEYIVTNDKIILQNTSNQNSFKQVRLYNTLGQLLYETHSSFITEIPMGALPKGIYLCEFTAEDGSKQVIKFFYPTTY